MEHYIEKLRSYLTEQKLPDASPQSILNMLYEAYNEINLMDDDKVKQDFHELRVDEWYAAPGDGSDRITSLHPLP